MNYLIGFVIFAGGLSILEDPAPLINIFGLPKGDVIQIYQWDLSWRCLVCFLYIGS